MRVPAPEPYPMPEPPIPATALGLGQWIERVALADLVAGAQGDSGGVLHPVLLRRGAVLAHGAPQIASPAFNRVFIGGEDVAPRAMDLALVLDRLRDLGVAQPMVHVHPAQLSDEIESVLAAQGFQPYRRHWVRLLAEPRDRVSWTPHDLRVRPVEPRDIPEVTELLLSCFGLHLDARRLIVPMLRRPGWHGYVVCERDRVVAAGTLLVRGETGYLCFGATHPEHRGRGAQSALIDKRLRVGFALGCRRIYAETGEAIEGEPNPSLNNMLRSGMRSIGVRLNYTRVGVRWS